MKTERLVKSTCIDESDSLSDEKKGGGRKGERDERGI